MRPQRLLITIITFTIAAFLSYVLYLHYQKLLFITTEFSDYKLYFDELLVNVLILLIIILNLIVSISSLIYYEDYNDFIKKLFSNIFKGIVNILFISLFISALVCLIIALVTPEFFFNRIDGNKLISASIILSVCLAGFLGGFVREILIYINTIRNQNTEDLQRNIWQCLFSIISSVFIALIFFLLLRAGILKSDKIDSFNIYGVAGISAVTGYFSDKIFERISRVYKSILDETSSKKE